MSKDIYILHYLFLFIIPSIKDYIGLSGLWLTENLFIELFLGTLLSIFIIYIVKFISRIIRTNTYLSFLLLGKYQ
jgi:hypothetical protein